MGTPCASCRCAARRCQGAIAGRQRGGVSRKYQSLREYYSPRIKHSSMPRAPRAPARGTAWGAGGGPGAGRASARSSQTCSPRSGWSSRPRRPACSRPPAPRAQPRTWPPHAAAACTRSAPACCSPPRAGTAGSAHAPPAPLSARLPSSESRRRRGAALQHHRAPGARARHRSGVQGARRHAALQ